MGGERCLRGVRVGEDELEVGQRIVLVVVQPPRSREPLRCVVGREVALEGYAALKDFLDARPAPMVLIGYAVRSSGDFNDTADLTVP